MIETATTPRAAFLAAALLALGVAAAAAAVDAPGEVDATVSVREVRAEGGAISATLANRGARELREVRLLFQWVYAWPDEYHPGESSPGGAWTDVVPGPIAPGASETVRFVPPGGLPEAPGSFEPRVQVLGYTEVGR